LADEYGKKPAKPLEVAKALGITPSGGHFKRLTGSALAYGLTEGGGQAGAIALTDLGRRIVAPTEEGDDKRALVEAFLKPCVICEFLEKYNDSKFPSDAIGKNVLEEMAVPPDRTALTLELIRGGAASLGLLTEINGQTYVNLEAVPTTMPQDHDGPGVDEDSEQQRDADETQPRAGDPSAPPEALAPKPSRRPNAIFVGHGKNKKPRDDVVKILAEYKIPYKVAQDEANRGRPIPTKVREVMEECGAAILIFTADEELFDKDGHSIWRPSENVVHELGAASMLYDNRIIIFCEEGVDLATNYESIGYIKFAKDQIGAKGTDLFRELIAFGIIKVAVNDE
jgi:predicted nucleotide-binding protein